jgi:O-antigen/teichoic acid export membrane protein
MIFAMDDKAITLQKIKSFASGISAPAYYVNSFVFQRIVAAGIVFLSSLFLAKALGSEVFGQVAFYMYLIKFILAGQLGSESGFFFRYYSNSLQFSVTDYFLFYSLHLLVVSGFVYLSSFWLGNIYFFASIGFALLIPFFSIGPLLRISRIFYATLLPDIIISLAAVASVCLLKYIYRSEEVNTNVILSSAVLFTLLVYPILLLLYKKLRLSMHFKIVSDVKLWESYIRIVRDGIPLYLATLAYTVLLLVDRFFLEKYHSSRELSLYMLSFQLAMGASLPMSSQNLVSVIDIGEKNRENASMRSVLQKQLKKSLIIGIPSYLCLIVLAFCLERWFLVGYYGLMKLSAALGLGLILFFVSGSVTPIAFYNEKQTVLTVSLFAMTIVSVIHNLAVIYFKLSSHWVAYFTSTWLILYSVFAIYFTWGVIRRK